MSREQAQVFAPQHAEALPRLGVVGVGAVGTTLAWSLAARGYPVVALAGRTPAAARWLAEQLPDCRAAATPAEVVDLAELVILAVPDDALVSVAASLPWRSGQMVIHCSGAAPAAVLARAGQQGALYGSFHPLVSIPRARPAGAEEALARLAAATDLWASFGVGREEALAALLPLLRSTVANLLQLGLPESLTGPIARGDLGTVHAHLEYLGARKAPRPFDAVLLEEVYRVLGVLSLPLARARGRLSEEQEAALRRLLIGNADGEAAIPRE